MALESASIISKSLHDLLMLMNLLATAMKCLLLFPIHIIKSTPNLKMPCLCQSHQLAQSNHFVPKINQLAKSHQYKKGVLSCDVYEADNFISADQYDVNTPNILLSGFGYEVPHS